MICSWKFASKFLKWALHSFFMRCSVRVVDDLVQLLCVVFGISTVPPYLVSICSMLYGVI